MHGFVSVWSWYVTSNRSLYLQSAEKSLRWSQSKMVVSVSCIQVAFVLSCKDRRWLLSSVKPVCYSSAYFHHCASSWWFSVCLCWTVSVIWMLLHHPPTDCPLREGVVTCRRLTKFKSWAEVCSPPHWWCWRSSSHHGLVAFAGVDPVEMPVLLWRWKLL